MFNNVSRRSFVVSAAAAGAAFGLNGRVEFLPSALAQDAARETGLNPRNLQFYKFKVGDIEVTQILDGEVIRPHAENFVRNATIEERQKALAAGGVITDGVPTGFTVTTAKIGDRRVIFDAGNGAAGLPASGRLTANMKAAGFEQKDVTHVVLTHFHPDHIFGLMDKDNQPLYPNAEIILPAAEINFWTDESRTSKLPAGVQGLVQRINATLAKWSNVRRFEGDAEVLPGVKPVASYGHTPGHTSFLLNSGAAQFMVLADVTNVKELFLRNPGWHVVFDMDPNAAEATRRAIFDRVIADKIAVSGYHWGMPGCGTISKDGAGYALAPMA
jgi:glyoxylase-like metal-dependent hydrolase (beta-lactamase superfamily II)